MQHELDTSGRHCPYPLAEAKKKLKQLKAGEQLRVISTDAGSEIDFKVFSEISPEVLLEHYFTNARQFIFILRKICGE